MLKPTLINLFCKLLLVSVGVAAHKNKFLDRKNLSSVQLKQLEAVETRANAYAKVNDHFNSPTNCMCVATQPAD